MEIISRLSRSFTFLVRTILNIKVTVVGEEGDLETGGYVIIGNHVSYVDGIVLGSMFPIVFFEAGGQTLADDRSVEDALRNDLYQSTEKGAGRVAG